MKTKFISLIGIGILILGAVFFAGCSRDQEVVSSVEEQSVDQRIIDMVQKATDDPVLQKEMQEELQFLLHQNVVNIDDVQIRLDMIDNDSYYQYNGDQMRSRWQVRKDIEDNKNNPSVSIRAHRRAPSFVNAGTYTVYVHPGVPTAWATAISQACSAWNGLNLIVNLGPVSANDYLISHYGAITVSMKNISGAYALADDPSGGLPGSKMFIDTDSPSLTASQKKLVIAHELGHTLGFKHTDTSEGSALNSSTHSCISSTCNSADGNSIMRSWNPVPSWAGFSWCDDNVFKCIYGLT